MRVFAVSDLHVDYAPNREWLKRLPLQEYNDDVLILAGDVSDRLTLLEYAFELLARRFSVVLYVPGNHDLWSAREPVADSFEKLERVLATAKHHSVRTGVFRYNDTAIVPLLGWYDYSFGEASDYLKTAWADYRACHWLDNDDAAMTRFFASRNPVPTSLDFEGVRNLITFSHFLPRIDLMPDRIPSRHRKIYPVLGSTLLENQLRQWRANIHVYGHSHVNRRITLDGVTYINNAFGYPSEARFTTRELVQVL